ncbi:MAG: hypothetical protein IKR73_07770, partial [Oscillospiraceae bacterium]|nr:hypothetical protein [Oscillospiraceae bacterium]
MDRSSTVAVACPLCGGDLQFDPTAGKLVCEYCGHEMTPEEAGMRYDTETDQAPPQDTADDDMKGLKCSACGAELVAEENTSATICPFCGNSTIVPSQLSGSFRPDFVIPFAFTKDQAMAKYKGYYSGKKLLPKSFADSNHVEDIQGVYVPFLLFDGHVDVRARYKAEDRRETSEEVEIKSYDVEREGSVRFKNVPTDASERMEDDLMDSIEPYDMAKLTEFNISYLPGFLAERSNTGEASERDRASKRVENTAIQLTRGTVKHHIVREDEHVDVHIEQMHYALLPVWYLVTKWDDKIWKFAMNGQTGKFIGDLPIDKGKLALSVIAAFAVAAVIAYLLSQSVGITVIAGLIAA